MRLVIENKLALRAGFNMRFKLADMEAMLRIRGGESGDVVAIYSTRLTRFSGERLPDQTDLKWQLRNWRHFHCP